MPQPTGTAALAIGQTISHRAGNAVITLTRTVQTWTVDTYQGPTRLDAWCYAYPSEAEARAAARHTALAFTAHGTDVAIAARRTDLTFEVRDLLHRRRPVRARLAAVEAEIDGLATLADLAQLQQLARDLAAFAA